MVFAAVMERGIDSGPHAWKIMYAVVSYIDYFMWNV